MADSKGCTCGSGAHPRRCDKHPTAYQRHIDELNRDARECALAYDEGHQAGREEERRAIVAWLLSDGPGADNCAAIKHGGAIRETCLRVAKAYRKAAAILDDEATRMEDEQP